jgi:hypothetical protein
MIEFNQAAQCLFCPQRRKIALLLKLMMCASAAIIVGLFLFLPRNVSAPHPRSNEGLDSVSLAATTAMDKRGEGAGTVTNSAVQEAVSKRSAEIRADARKRFQDVQLRLRPLLSGTPMQLAEAAQLLDNQRRDLLAAKVLVLGEELFSSSSHTEAQRTSVLEELDKDLNVLAEQGRLLNEMRRAENPAQDNPRRNKPDR